jgi:hypothetical protein
MEQAQGQRNGRFIAVDMNRPANTYLYTPPEQMSDSFTSQHNDADQSKQTQQAAQLQEMENILPPIHTPPTSPDSNTLPNITAATGYSSPDPQLYPDEQTQRPESHTPLFASEPVPAPVHAPAAPPLVIPRQIPPRERIFPWDLLVKDGPSAYKYWEARHAELIRDQQRRMRANHKLPTPTASSYPLRENFDQLQLGILDSRTRSAGVTKVRSPPKQAAKPKAPAAASPARSSPPARRRTPKSTPKARMSHDFNDAAFGSTQQPTKHKRAAPTKKVENDNLSWHELPDYSPPADSLDNSGKTMKVEWKTPPVSLDADPDRQHMHPQELRIAGALRLTGASYLSNKRKIFQAKLQHLRDGKNFTKTAAQTACSIDVNKASQLWEAFDKVGWFKESWFQKYL